MATRVLLVDEDEAAGAGLARRLARHREIESVRVASGLEQANALMESDRFDVVLLDLHRREVAPALCRELSRTEAPLILLASFMTPEAWEETHQAGAAGYLLKRVDSERLGLELARMAGRTSLDGVGGAGSL